MLRLLTYLKEIVKSSLPRIKLYNVICNLNYHEIEKMLDFALDMGADYLEFTPIDIVPNKTGSLLLNLNQQVNLLEQLEKLIDRIDRYDNICPDLENKDYRHELTDIGRCVNKHLIPKGFIYNFNRPSDVSVICPEGNKSVYFYPDEETDNFFFRFSKLQCKKCSLLEKCAIDKTNSVVKIKFLKILGFHSFYRRITSEGAFRGEYDNRAVDSLPCYAGWTYSRILPNADVIPCCKADRNPVGNIGRNNFSHLWNSKLQREFRYMGRDFHKSHHYFAKINCHKSCDNLGMNLEIEARLKSLTCVQKLLIKSVTIFYNFKNSLIRSPKSKSIRFIIILMLLYLELITDIYMLFLRLLRKKIIFPEDN